MLTSRVTNHPTASGLQIATIYLLTFLCKQFGLDLPGRFFSYSKLGGSILGIVVMGDKCLII